MHELLTSSSFHEKLQCLPVNNGVISVFYKRETGESSNLEDAIKMIESITSFPVDHANVFCMDNDLVMAFGFSMPGCNADLMVYHDSRKSVSTYQILHREQVSIHIPSMTKLLLINEDPANLLDLHFGEKASQAEQIIEAFGLRVKTLILDQLEYQANVLELEKS